jgi:hypothetical protein
VAEQLEVADHGLARGAADQVDLKVIWHAGLSLNLLQIK